MRKFAKIKTDIGSKPARAISSTLGRLVGLPMAVVFPRALENPYNGSLYDANYPSALDQKDKKALLHKYIADKLGDAHPEQLDDVVVHLGGPRFFSDYGRIWTNKRTGILGKLFGSLSYPVGYVLGAIQRGSQYNPYSNTVDLYNDNPAILTHELGHAIDINSWRKPEKANSVFDVIANQFKSIPRDAYTIGRGLFGADLNPIELWQETKANTRSLSSINKAFKKDPKTLENIKTLRWRSLPSAYSTYIYKNTLPFAPALYSPLGTVITGGSVRALNALREDIGDEPVKSTSTIMDELRQAANDEIRKGAKKED